MKKSIFSYLLFSLLCISNITWAAAGGAGASAYDGRGGGRRAVSGGGGGGGSGAAAMPVEDLDTICAYASLAAYPDDGGVDTALYLVTQGYSITNPNEHILIAQKGGGYRSAVTSGIIAFRGSETLKDWEAGKKVLVGTGWNESVDMIGGRPIPRLMEENGIDGKCIGSYAEIFNGLLSDIQSLLYKKGQLTLTGHSMGGVLAQYAALEGYARLREPVSALITFGSPAAFEGPIVRFFDSIIPHKRYYFSGDWAPKLGRANHTGTGYRLDGSTHSMIKYLDAVE